MDSDSRNEVEVNFLRRQKLSLRDCLDYLKNKAKSGDMAVLELTFRKVSLGKWSKNWSCYRRHTLKCWIFACKCIFYFQSWWMFSPSDRMMCPCTNLNQTCFAGVVTRPETIFRNKNSFPFVSMFIYFFGNISVSTSDFNSWWNQVFLILEWILNLVSLSKILDCLKRLFVVQIPWVTVYSEIRNIYV